MRSHAVDNEVRVLARLRCQGAAKVPQWVGQMRRQNRMVSWVNG